MINLLPAESKEELRAAKLNVVLVRYVVIQLCTYVFLGFAFAAAHYQLGVAKTEAASIAAANQDKASVYSDTEAEARSLRQNLADAKVVLGGDIDYAAIVAALGKLLPEGVIIDSLKLDQSVLSNQTTLQLYATTTDAAFSAQNALKASPLFSSVTAGEVSSQGGITGYPVTATVSVTFTKAQS